MLSGDLRRRYQSAADAQTDLHAFRAGGETRADREWLAESDREATRRTVDAPSGGVQGDSEATRRTMPPPLPGTPNGPVPSSAVAAAPPARNACRSVCASAADW